jgi:hypothetical protein
MAYQEALREDRVPVRSLDARFGRAEEKKRHRAKKQLSHPAA